MTRPTRYAIPLETLTVTPPDAKFIPDELGPLTELLTQALRAVSVEGNKLPLEGPTHVEGIFSLIVLNHYRRTKAAIARALKCRVRDLAEDVLEDGTVILTLKDNRNLLRHICRERYVQMCSNRAELEIQNAQAGINAGQSRLAELYLSILQYERDLVELRRRLDCLLQNNFDLKERLRTEFDKIVALPWVEGVRVSSRVVSVTTTEVRIPGETVEVPIGKFRIEIHPERGIYFHNISPGMRAEGYSGAHHPHVYSNGQPCLGDFGRPIAEALALLHLDVALQLAWQFLNQYNPESPVQFITPWILEAGLPAIVEEEFMAREEEQEEEEEEEDY